MTINPLSEKGRPIEQQVSAWPKVNVTPYNKREIHPYTRSRIILMNGIEVEAVIFKHQAARHTSDLDIKRVIALSRHIEQQQQKMINWLVPHDETSLEVTIGYEQVAVDLTAYLARTEPDPNVKAALDFALLEDFDHLYRYANLMEMTEGRQAEANVRELTEIMPGRPTALEHRHPMDLIRMPYDNKTANILTKLHVLTIISGEQQTMNLYMNIGNRAESPLARGLYLEIGQVEEQHVSHYESLADPTTSWFEMLLLHEYNECYMYYSCMETETDPRFKDMWRRHLEDEITHLHIAAELMKKHEKRDPADILPSQFPELTVFQSNRDYVRQILGTQIDLTSHKTDFMPVQELPEDALYPSFQKTVNREGAFSQQVIEEHIGRFGADYRHEIEGPHPDRRLRTREKVAMPV